MANGFDAKAFLQTLTPLPGVYRMLDGEGRVLYVGKARNLKRRVASYFRSNPSSAKIQSLVAQTHHMEITITHTEGEALILESTLIKQHRPRYNVLLRDDKGYPYIHLSDSDYPRLSFHRGSRRAAGRYFGPYPSAGAVRDSLQLLQRVFKLRQCDDSFFRNRSRPCLQYQIKRCSAPCTGMISDQDYHRDVEHAVLLLEGKSEQVLEELGSHMDAAAQALRFEEAGVIRDQIRQLRRLQEHQYVSGEKGDLDAVACYGAGGLACIQVFFFRDGRLLGNKAFFPSIPDGEEIGSILAAFIAQYYLDKNPPAEILVNHLPNDAALLEQVLREQSGHGVSINTRVRGERARWLTMAAHNAEQALKAELSSKAGIRQRFEALQDVLELDATPQRLECFDISHTLGESTVASCVVFDQEGPRKSDYRRYNIDGITAGDDYAAMHQALERRYTRLKSGEGKIPDLLFIDGGKGQLAQALAVLEELQVAGVTIIGVAKGVDRKPGMEILHRAERNHPLVLPSDSAALHLIQQIRDEAHRFAITGHRQRRAQTRNTSILQTIPGIGQKRRQRLLRQFGGLQQLARAGVEDIARVEGISRELAQRIYDVFHDNG